MTQHFTVFTSSFSSSSLSSTSWTEWDFEVVGMLKSKNACSSSCFSFCSAYWIHVSTLRRTQVHCPPLPPPPPPHTHTYTHTCACALSLTLSRSLSQSLSLSISLIFTIPYHISVCKREILTFYHSRGHCYLSQGEWIRCNLWPWNGSHEKPQYDLDLSQSITGKPRKLYSSNVCK